jgi:hypothetical protein
MIGTFQILNIWKSTEPNKEWPSNNIKIWKYIIYQSWLPISIIMVSKISY